MDEKRIGIKRIGVVDYYREWIKEDTGDMVTLNGGLKVRFEVKEWYPKTKDKQKKKIIWKFKHLDQMLDYDDSNLSFPKEIPKGLCGSIEYTLTAHIEGQEDEAELIVRGESPPLIINSSWVTQSDGITVEIKNREKGSPVPFGTPVKLHLETEGLNGRKLFIEVYVVRSITENFSLSALMGDATANDLKIHQCSWECIDGEINMPLSTQKLRQKLTKIKDIELLYVKVKYAGEYIIDDIPYHDTLHAIGLCLKKEEISTVDSMKVNMPTNVSTTRVGSNPLNPIEYGGCTFKTITLYESGTPFLLFNGGYTHTPAVTDKRHYIKEQAVFFDTDKDYLDSDNAEQLRSYAEYFVRTDTSLKLQGYADNRASNKYNEGLAARRVRTVKETLIRLGVKPNRIGADSYGKYRATGNDSESRKQDRRVSIYFDVFAASHKPIVCETVTPDILLPVHIQVEIKGYTNKSCFIPGEEHKHKPILTIDSITKNDKIEIAEGEDSSNPVNLDIYAETYDMSYLHFLEVLAMRQTSVLAYDRIAEYACIYTLGLHTCTYFSQKNSPTVIIIAYPDAHLVGHLRYDYETDYFFEDMPVKLLKGAPFLSDVKEKLDKYLIEPLADLFENTSSETYDDALDAKIAFDLIWEEIQGRVDMFQTGVHALYNFKDGAYKVRDFTEENPITTELSHILYAVYQLIIELIIAYFTRGRGSVSKIKNVKKLRRVLKFMEDNNLEIITPKVAESYGAYYKKMEDGRVARIYKLNIDADPLLGIKYEQQFDLNKEEDRKKILKNSSLRGWFEKAQSKGWIQDAKMDIKLSGSIAFEFNLTLNTLTGMAEGERFTERWTRNLNNSSIRIVPGSTITGVISFKIKGEASKDIQLLPFADKTHFDAKYELKGEEITMGVTWNRIFFFSLTKPYLQDEFIFTGIKGKYMQRIKVYKDGDKTWDSNPEAELVTFELLPELTFRTDPIYLPFT